MNTRKLTSTFKVFLTGMIGLLVISGIAPSGWHLLSAQTDQGTIAYVRANDESGDEIWLIEPNGSSDRRIWSTGQADPNDIEEIFNLAWRPNAAELAFTSNHEKYLCSIFESDIYGIYPDGNGYRRITNAPACDEFDDFPKGTVQIEVDNQSNLTARFSVYVQGASEFQGIFVGSGQVETVTFIDVADFGPDILQYAVAINNLTVDRRSWGAPVDVKAGDTAQSRLSIMNDDALLEFGAKTPTWRSDGARIGYVLGLGSVNQIDANPEPADLGEPLLPQGAGTTPINHLAWSPVPAMANQLLYTGRYDDDDSSVTGIYRISEGGQGLGEQMVAADSWESVHGLAWLPDGSGFVYAITENYDENANIHVYNFESGESTQLTNFSGEFARKVSVSPDGQQIVFERATALWPWDQPKVDLWIMDGNGSNLQLLVENALAPAWSPGPIQNPPATTPTPVPTHTPMPDGSGSVFLPFTQK